MSALTLLQTAPALPYRSNFTDPDATPWKQEWSTEGDGAQTLWDFSGGTLSPWSGGPNFTAAITTANTHSGTNAVTLTRNSATAGNGYLLNAGGVLSPNFRHLFSVWVYASVPTVYTLKLVPKTAANAAAGTAGTMDFVPPVGKWFRQTMLFTASATATNADLYITDDSNLNPILNSTLIVDDITVSVMGAAVLEYYNTGWLSTGTGVANAYIRADLANGPSLSDTEVVADVSSNIALDSYAFVGINGAIKDNPSPRNTPYSLTGYALYIQYLSGGTNSVFLCIQGMVSGVDTLMSTTAIVPAINGYNRIRFKRVGTHLYGRLWDPAGPEPGTWDVTATITDGANYTGVVSVGAITNAAGANRQTYFNNINVNTPSTVTGSIKYWNGSIWVAKPVKVWNGTAWVAKPVKRWNGSAWVVTTY